MSKDAYWFTHDSNARMDEKTLELRARYDWEGYGIFWAVIETLREQSRYEYQHARIAGLAVSIGKPREWMEQFIADCIEIGLLASDGQVFYSQSLNDRMARWDERRDSNRKAAHKRWESKGDADAMQMHSECNADPMLEQNRIEENRTEQNILDLEKEVITKTAGVAPPNGAPPAIALQTNKGEEYPITQSLVTEYSALYPAVDVMAELRKMRAWLISNPKNRKTANGMLRFVNTWLSREQDKGGKKLQPQQSAYGNKL
jgi:hypothetical protein